MSAKKREDRGKGRRVQPAPLPKTQARSGKNASEAKGKTAASLGPRAAPLRKGKGASRGQPADGKTDAKSKPAAKGRGGSPASSGRGGFGARPKVRDGSRAARSPRTRRHPAKASAPVPLRGVSGLTEEEQIESAKYLPRDLPPRLFEEERFLFPESYGINRVRLLVKDPEWIFAYWDVDPSSLEGMRTELGGRVVELSRLTLRMMDPGDGAMSTTLLPPGARSWYFRVSPLRRAYRADLGLTLPSGEFRGLAESNTVVTPRVGPSAERAARRHSYSLIREGRGLPPGGLGVAAGFTDLTAEGAPALVADPGSGAASSPLGASAPSSERGGASDVYRR